MTRALIFDLDGVLVDTARFHYLAWKRLAEEAFGFDLTPRLNESFKGVNRAACMELLLKWTGASLPVETVRALMDKKNAWYLEYVDGMTPDDLLPGAEAFALSAREAGYKLSIGSASKNCRRVLDRTGIAHLFDAIVDGLTVSRAKPDPEVFLKAAEQLGEAPGDCAVFEDAQAGLDAARAGGMKAIAVGSPQSLHGYDAIVDGLANARLGDLRILQEDSL